MKKIFIGCTVLAVIMYAACSPKTNPSTTVTPPPPVVVKEIPKRAATNYVDSIMPLIQANCTPCHLPSKGGNKANFENYASAKLYGLDMSVRVQLNPGDKGFMPFKHAKLSDADIAVFKRWVSYGLEEK